MREINANSEKVISDPCLCFVKQQVKDDKPKMLLVSPDEENRLITFDVAVADENCTVQDLLQQVNIPPGSNTKVSLIKDLSPLGINYITVVEESWINSHLQDDDGDDDLSSGNLPLNEIATNESGSSDIFSMPKGGKGSSSTMQRKINNDRRQVLQSEENESRDFEGAGKKHQSMTNLSLTEKPGSSEEREMTNMTETDSTMPRCTFLTCKAVMLGSYYFVPERSVIISERGIEMRVPDLEDETNFISVELEFKDVMKVLVNFKKKLPVLFVWASSTAGYTIREQIGMHDPKRPYYDPIGTDDKHKRMTLLPEMISEESKQVLKELFQPNKVIEELNNKAAYAILAKATPNDIWPELEKLVKESAKEIKSMVDGCINNGVQTKTVGPVTELTRKTIEESGESTSKLNSVVKNKTRKRFVYSTKPARGGISINIEDYACMSNEEDPNEPLVFPSKTARGCIVINTTDYTCLNEGEFLNDVIIDFYLKYLTLEILSLEDRNRTYVFSSHFYTRLISKCQTANDESAASLSQAAKRHANVCRWTKNVNIFEKDFILVPIVEAGHWFLAIICFPNLVGKVGEEVTEWREHGAKQRMGKLKTDTAVSEKEIRKFPCILVFDSLAGTANQAQVAARLRDYLTYEHLAKIGTKKIFSSYTIKLDCPKVPQQPNHSDCGIYILQYAESFFKHPIEDYTFPIKTLEYWFEKIVVTRKRNELKELIKKLAKN